MLVCGVCLFFISMFCFKGFMLLEPNEARVVMFFGKYKGTFYETGFWWINPFMGRKKISVRARNLNVEPIKVNDKNGNPVMIGLVLVWKIRPDEIYRAVFDIDASTMGGTDLAVSASARMKVLENFVSVQSDAALRQVAGYYAYDNNGVADAEPLQAVQTFMDQHKAEQSRHDGRECGDNGKVGDCRILQPSKLGNVIDADAKDAHGK